MGWRTCTNCGHSEERHSEIYRCQDCIRVVAVSLSCQRFTTEPGGADSRICTHLGGHRDWCPRGKKEVVQDPSAVCICIGPRSRYCTAHP